MSAVLSALPELPKLVEPAQTINGKRIRVAPRVNLGDITINNLGTVRKLHNVLFPVSYNSQFYAALNDDRLHHPEDYCKLVYYQDLPVGVIVCRLEEAELAPPKNLGEASANHKAATEAAAAAAAAAAANEDGETEKKKMKRKVHKYDDDKAYKLYVMTLGVLAPYRHQGLGSKLIHHVLSTAAASLAQPAPPATSTASPQANGTSPVASSSSSSKSKPDPKKKAASEADKGDSEQKKKDDAATEAEAADPLKPRIESVYLHVQVGNDDAKRFWEKWGFEVKETVPDYYRKISPRDAWLLERKITPSAASTDSA